VSLKYHKGLANRQLYQTAESIQKSNRLTKDSSGHGMHVPLYAGQFIHHRF